MSTLALVWVAVTLQIPADGRAVHKDYIIKYTHTITYSSESKIWTPPAEWCEGGVNLGVIVMYGEAKIADGETSARLNDCSAMFLRVTSATSVTLKSATALIWTPSMSDISDLPHYTKLALDETSATILHDVFFEHKRSVPHQQAALKLVYHQLQNSHNHTTLQLPLPFTAHDTQQTLVTLITNHLQSHLDETTTLDSLAKQFRCSKTEITKSFQKEKGETPSQMLARLRLKHAEDLLQNSDRTISQIAYAVGYQDLAGFSHFFKNQTGHSPSEFRDNCHWLV